MNVKLAIENGDAISSVFTIADADFTAGQGTVEKAFTADIVNSKLPNGKYITLQYNVPINGATTYTTYGQKKYIINNSGTPTDGGTPSTTGTPEIRAKIASMGFGLADIKRYSSYYRLEGDVRLDINSLEQPNITNYTVNNTYNHNINISIDESVWGTTWYNDLLEAVRVWNSGVNNDIKINVILDKFNYGVAPRVDIFIKASSSLTTATESEYPRGDGKPGSLIVIRSNFNSPTGDNILNLVHAIGHSLGLIHTPATAQGYQNSVMKRGDATVSAWSFLIENYGLPSTYDINNIGTKYPVNSGSTIQAYINGPDTFNATASVTYRMSYISSEAGINYHWKVIGVAGTNYTSESYENNAALFDFGLPQAGKYQLQCTISGGKYTTPVTSTKNITVL